MEYKKQQQNAAFDKAEDIVKNKKNKKNKMRGIS